MPWPLSTTSISSWPAPRTRMAIRLAPASIAFSASSLTTAAGRSTTSPAAIPSATAAGSTTMVGPDSTFVSGAGMLSLPGVQLFQRLPRREPLQVELLQFGYNRMLQRQAQLRRIRGPFQRTLTFELGEYLAGPHHHLPGKAGQLGHVDPVAAVGATLHHLVQEDDALALFADFHPEVPQPGQALRQRGQLVVVGGEQGQGAQLGRVVQVLEDRLGDTDAVVGAGAA